MIAFYLLISAVYAGVFYAYMHNHKDNRDLWHHYSNSRYNRETGEDVFVYTPTGDWNGLAIALFLLGVIFWPLMIPALIVFRLANKFFKNKNK